MNRKIDIQANPFLRIVVDEYACPAFCSFAKAYFGTVSDIDEFIENNADSETDSESTNNNAYKNTWDLFKEGDEDAQIFVAMNQQKMVSNTQILSEKTLKIAAETVDVKNIYEYESKIRWDEAIVDVKWVETESIYDIGEKLYIRIAKYDFCGLSIQSVATGVWSYPSMISGIKGMLVCEPDEPEHCEFTRPDGTTIVSENIPRGRMRTRLWIPDKYFEDKNEMLEDIEKYRGSNDVDINFSRFYQEIVADG